MNHLTSILGKVGLSPFVGGNFDSLVFSPAAVVYSNEIIRQSRIFSQGFPIDLPEMNIDEILAMGSGGNYLEAGSTTNRFREFMFESPVWPGYTLDQWHQEGCPSSGKLLREHTRYLLKETSPPEDQAALMEKGERFIHEFKNQ